MVITGLTPEQKHFGDLLQKCRQETHPQRLLNHMQALKTFLLAHVIQQSTLYHQLHGGQIVEGEIEAHLVKECAGCMGESKKLLSALHDFITQYEDEQGLDSMEFRASAFQLLKRFEQNLNRFRDWLSSVTVQGPAAPV
ncbi:MAG: hypothetical protein HQL58_08890 [Magnetococcales bacterium]|nr:hypothetical protein [Magnetococcales bacterium]